jgi:hypothetical protein
VSDAKSRHCRVRMSADITKWLTASSDMTSFVIIYTASALPLIVILDFSNGIKKEELRPLAR